MFMAKQQQEEDQSFMIQPRPAKPIITADLDLSKLVNQNTYLGFAASTGEWVQLNCVLRWNLTVEKLPSGHGDQGGGSRLKIGLAVGVSGVVILVVGLISFFYYVYRQRRKASDPAILGALKSLPGTPKSSSIVSIREIFHRLIKY